MKVNEVTKNELRVKVSKETAVLLRWGGIVGCVWVYMNPHTTQNSSIRSDEGLTLETSAF